VKIESIIELLSWVVMIALLLIFVPKKKFREAQIIFLIQQVLTWPLGFLVAEMNLIEYPVRFFENASRTSFTFEYFVYPAISVLFVLYYPNKQSWVKRILYYASYCTAITGIEVVLEKYTDLIVYNSWNSYYTWLGLFVTFYLSKRYYRWFFKK